MTAQRQQDHRATGQERVSAASVSMAANIPSRSLPLRTALRRGVLIELVGACLVLLASIFTTIGWVPAFGQAAMPPWPDVLGLVPFFVLVGGLAAMVGGYGISLRALGRAEPSQHPGLAITLLATLLLAAPLLLLATIPSSDLYTYVMYGRIEAIHGGNPYTTPPIRFGWDPFVQLLGDRTLVSAYGPAWQAVARLIAAGAGEGASPAVFVLVYKLLGLAMLLVGSALIWAILGRLAPTEQARGTWFYAANPLCLLELAGAGHNDGFMVVLVLLAALAQVRGRTILTVICLGLAVLTKWVALLLVPAYLMWLFAGRGLRWRAVRDLLAGTVLLLVIGAGLYGKNWVGLRTLEAVTRNLPATQLHNSLAAWTADQLDPARQVRRPARSEPWARNLLSDGEERPRQRPLPPPRVLSPIERAIKWAFSLVFAAWALVLLPRAYGIRELLAVWGWTLFAYICLASVWFWPWYVIWVLALAALAPGTSLARAAMVLSTTALLITVARAVQPSFGYEPGSIPLFVFLPPLGYAALMYLLRRQRWRQGGKGTRGQGVRV